MQDEGHTVKLYKLAKRFEFGVLIAEGMFFWE
jgi:hypothetical protein